MIGLHPDKALHILYQEAIPILGSKDTRASKPLVEESISRVVRVDGNLKEGISLVVASFPAFRASNNLPSNLLSWG